jgi:DNA-binding CsgD family transcriptional regulator
MREIIIPGDGLNYSKFGKISGNLASSVLDKISTLICIIDFPIPKVIWANNYFLNALGFSITELRNLQSEELIALVHPDFHKYVREAFANPFSEKENVKNTICRVRTKGGKWLWVMVNCSLYEMNPGEGYNHLIMSGIDFEIVRILEQFHKLEEADIELQQTRISQILTCRQITVLKLISKGKTDKEIADNLCISIHTAKTYRKKIIHKLGFKNTGTLINFIVEHHLG